MVLSVFIRMTFRKRCLRCFDCQRRQTAREQFGFLLDAFYLWCAATRRTGLQRCRPRDLAQDKGGCPARGTSKLSFPSGVTATIGKRFEYLEWAREKRGFLLWKMILTVSFMPGKPRHCLCWMTALQSYISIHFLKVCHVHWYGNIFCRLMERYKLSSR